MRPTSAEYSASFERYVSLVTEDDVLPLLDAQASGVRSAVGVLSAERAGYRYAPGKWSVRETIGHLIDTERVFGYRALSIARGETFSLPPFDENRYADVAGHDRAPIGELAEEFASLRRGHVLMLQHLEEEAWTRKGVVNQHPTTPRGLAFIMAGHVRHHALILTDRYGVAVRA